MTETQRNLPRDYRHNFTAFTVDYVAFVTGMYFISSNTVIPSFIRQLTNSAPLVGLGGTLFSVTLLLPQLLVAKIVEGKPRKLPYLIAALPGRILLPVIAVALWSGLAGKPETMLLVFFVAVSLFGATDAFVTLPVLDILARAIPANRRGRLFGLSQVIVGIAGIGAGAIIASILGASGPSFPKNYALLFTIATVFLIPSTSALLLLKEPAPGSHQEPTQPTRVGNWLRFLVDDTDFRRLIVCRVLLGGAGLAVPFFVGHAEDVLQLPGGIIGAFVIAQTLGSILASAAFGAISDRWGPRYVARVGSA
ncbi:MAG: MFS transporter, partial [Anaerolineae bacterium]|nr:MFS transporter [Anaerolineae bacterium]